MLENFGNVRKKKENQKSNLHQLLWLTRGLLLLPGFGQHGGLPGQLLHPIHLISPVHTAAHHSRQPQGLNILHGAGERDRPLPSPLSCPAQVASAPLSTHLKPPPPPSQPRAFRSGLMFQLCVSICTVVMFDVAFNIKKVRGSEMKYKNQAVVSCTIV